MDYTIIDDEALMRLVSNAQELAMSELYDRYSRLVYSVAYNTLRSDTLAEEIAQEVFIRVWEKAHTYQAEQGRVATWLASITRNRSIDLIRRNQVRPEGHRVDWAEAISPDLPDSIDVEKQVEVAQQQKQVRAALAQLPEEQRHTLALAYFQGLSHSEIAQTLNEPLGTVKTRIRLAMQKLRQLLEYE